MAIRERCRVILGLHQREISPRGIDTRKIDLSSADAVLSAIRATGTSTVVHTAGLTSVEKCEEDPELARHVNVDLAANVAQACRRAMVPLVHISTDHLFSGDTSFADEGDLAAPVNIYGRTKAEAESRVLDTYPEALLIRTNFYGWAPCYRQSFSDVIIGRLRLGRTLTLFRDVFYTPILIRALIEAIHELIRLRASGVLHVVGDERLSKYDFGLKIADKFDLDEGLIKPGLLREEASLVRRPYDMSLSNRKACRLLGKELGVVEDQIARLHQEECNGFALTVRSV